MAARMGTALLAIALLAGAATADEAMTLADKGVARAVVVVADDAMEPEKYAATELVAFLKQVTGAAFKVASKAPKDTPRLLVGPGAARQADATFSVEGLGEEGIVLRTVGSDLILAGGRPRGTLYAVYTFLEDHVGCRWWSSKASTIPRKATLTVGPLDVRYVPPLEYREPFWYDAFDGDWAVRNKSNGHSVRVDAKRGGKHIYEGFVHTFNHLIPPATYFKDHPEWFSEIKGKRTAHRAQLCLTNEDMRRELVRNLKARLRKHPAATIASVSQNDWWNPCTCKACAAIDKEEGSYAGTLLRFVNAVAADIEEEFPRVAISTLAYQYTRRPPKLVTPRSNVIVRLCSIECSFSHPLGHEGNRALRNVFVRLYNIDCAFTLPQIHEWNRVFRDDIVGWSKICDRLYIWDYTTNFRHYILPHPNLRVLGPNVKFFVAHNVKGLFEQGAYTSYGAEMAELRAWVLAKLLWDPTLDAAKLIDEFLAGYYGPAAKHIRAYLDVTHDAVEASGDHLGCFSPHTAKFLSFDTLHRGWAHLVKAEGAVKDDPDLLQRVRVAQLPVMYTFLMRWKDMRRAAKTAKAPWPLGESVDDVYKHFRAIAKDKKITHVREHRDGFDVMDEAVKRARP